MKEMCEDFVADVAAQEMTDGNAIWVKKDVTESEIQEMDGNAWLIQRIGLAQAMVPYQPNANKMSEAQGLVCGTIFPDLVQPYVQGRHLKENQ